MAKNRTFLKMGRTDEFRTKFSGFNIHFGYRNGKNLKHVLQLKSEKEKKTNRRERKENKFKKEERGGRKKKERKKRRRKKKEKKKRKLTHQRIKTDGKHRGQ